MDRDIRWLRRYVLWHVFRQLALEAVVAACGFATAAIFLNASWFTAAAVGAIAAQALVAIRLVMALNTGAVDTRYLLTWENASNDLRRGSRTNPGSAEQHRALEETEFRFLTTLTWDDDPESEDGYAVYGVDSGIVVVCVGLDDEPMVVLSRLSDDRLLLTTSEVIPTCGSMLVYHSDSAEIESLVARHAKAIAELRLIGLSLTTVGPEAISEYFDAEWHAWDQLGPFIGSFLRVAAGNQPLALDVRLPSAQLWSRALRSSTTQVPDPVASTRVGAPVPTLPAAAQQQPARNSSAGSGTPTPVRYPPGTAPSWTTKQRAPNRPIGSPTST